MGYVIVKTKGKVKTFFTIKEGRKTLTNDKSKAIEFANKKSAQMLADADWMVPGKSGISVELKDK